MFIIYYSDLNSHDGSNTHILELLHNLNKYVDAKLFAPKGKQKVDILNLRYIPYFKVKYLGSLSYELSLGLHLVYYFSRTKPQIVYLRQNSISFLPVILCKIFRIRVIVEINGLIHDEFFMQSNNKSIFSKIYGYLCLKSEKFNYKNCSKIISVTDRLKEELSKIYGIQSNNIAVINNGANTDLFKPTDSQEAKSILNLCPYKNYVCFVGNLAPWQGVEYIIEASPLILEKEPNTLFLIVGDGTMKQKLLKLALDLKVADSFIFTGNVAYETVPIYINASNVCVVPKKPLKSGYSPLKLYEYMACGKPIIASNVNGFEILEQINAGLLVNPENSAELSSAAIKLLSDSHLGNMMGWQGCDYVGKHHSWNAVAKKVLDVCENTLEVK